jgi:hypothetical protein
MRMPHGISANSTWVVGCFSNLGSETGFLVRLRPEPCLILSRAQIRALLCSS